MNRKRIPPTTPTSKWGKEVFAWCQREGAANVKYLGQTTGDHLKFLITAPNGKQMVLITSLTPSDTRAKQNNISLVRRFCRQNP